MPVQADFAGPVAVDLGDQVPAVGHGERPVGAAETMRRIVRADAGLADDPVRAVGGRRDQEQPAVLDIGGDDRPARHHHRVVGVGQMVVPVPRHTRRAVPVDDPVGGDVDHADDRVFLLGRDDVLAVGREERIVGQQEGLAVREVTAAGELPADPAMRVDDQEPVVPVVGDQDVTRQHRRVRMGCQVAPAVGGPQPRGIRQERARARRLGRAACVGGFGGERYARGPHRAGPARHRRALGLAAGGRAVAWGTRRSLVTVGTWRWPLLPPIR